jgi:hypothetical protein
MAVLHKIDFKKATRGLQIQNSTTFLALNSCCLIYDTLCLIDASTAVRQLALRFKLFAMAE